MHLLSSVLLLCLCAMWQRGAQASVARGESGEIRMFTAAATYSVETTALLYEAARKTGEVGYKIQATLHLTPVWTDHNHQFLLKFHLSRPQLLLRGKHVNAEFEPRASFWDEHPASASYAHWSRGRVHHAYLHPDAPPDLANYHKALISLFQFQIMDGEQQERDVSGACRVLYETLSDTVFRKIKRDCVADEAEAEAEGGQGAEAVEARRVARYTLSGALDALAAVHAEELLVLGHADAGLKARAWQTLTLQEGAGAGAGAPAGGALADALAPLLGAGLQAHTLALTAPPALALLPDDDLDLERMVEEVRPWLADEAAGEGGRAAHAAAALRLLPALRAAPPDALRRLLAAPDNTAALPGLVRALGLAAAPGAHAAAAAALHLRDPDPSLHLATLYLAALGLAARPDARVVAAALDLGEDARAPPALAAAALLAAAAAAPRASAAAALEVRDALRAGLARCKDDECRAVRLRALGNLRREDVADTLLEAAERGRGAAALAAVASLALLPPAALPYARRLRLERLALSPTRPLELRAAALDLAVCASVRVPLPLQLTARALHAEPRAPAELRRVFWQRLEALAARHDSVAELVRGLRRDPALGAWETRALAGTSSVLERDAGWAAAGRGVRLESVQVAAGGLLRRGTVRLLASDAHNHTTDLFAVEMWTRGLEAFAGGAAEAGGAGEEAAAGGLALTVGGVQLPGVTLFDGQAELLGHIWSGAGSAATPVTRAVVPWGAERVGALPLVSGQVVRHAGAAGAALALDAQAQVSLWSRSARSLLELRGAAWARRRAALGGAWGAVRAHVEAALEPRLRIDTDLDFYDAVALCVRVRLDPHVYARNGTLASTQGARRWRVRRERREGRAAEGRTLALGAPNDAECRTLVAAAHE